MTNISNLHETHQLFEKIKNCIDEFGFFTKSQFKVLVFCRYGKIQNNVYNFISEFFFQKFLEKSENGNVESINCSFLLKDNCDKDKFNEVISNWKKQFEIIDKILVKLRSLSLINESGNIEIENLNDEFVSTMLDEKIQNEELDKLLEIIEESDSENESDNFSLDDILVKGNTIKFSYNSFMKNILNQETIQKILNYDENTLNPYIGLKNKNDLHTFFCESFSTDNTYEINHVNNNNNLYYCSCPHFEHVCSKHYGMECKHIKLLKKIISYLTNYFKNDKWLCFEDITNIFKEIATISENFIY